MKKENETLDDIREDMLKPIGDYWKCYDTSCYDCPRSSNNSGQTCHVNTMMDIADRIEQAVRAEYKERAYQYYEARKNDTGITSGELRAMSEMLDTSYSSLKEEFENRYEVEHDSFDKIQFDFRCLMAECELEHGSVEERYEWLLNITNRLIAIMERDK